MSNTFHPWPGHPCAGHGCDGCTICRAGGCCGAHAIAAGQQIDSVAELRQALHQLVTNGGGTPTLRSLASGRASRAGLGSGSELRALAQADSAPSTAPDIKELSVTGRKEAAA